MVSDAGRPVLLDFGLAFLRGASARVVVVSFVKTDGLQRVDQNQIQLCNQDSISDADLKYYQPTALERIFRQWRRFWRTITLRQWRKMRTAQDSEVGQKQ